MGVELQVFCSYTDLLPTADLLGRRHPLNPNTHPQDQIRQLADVLKKNGWRAPIVVSKRSGLIPRGHGRLEAACKLKADSCPVDYQDYASEAAEVADMVADTTVQQMGLLDYNVCAEVVNSVISQPDFGDYAFCVSDSLLEYSKEEKWGGGPVKEPWELEAEESVKTKPREKRSGNDTFHAPLDTTCKACGARVKCPHCT